MYIYQIDRALLQEQVRKAAGELRGKTLDVGSGSFGRYELPESVTEYVRMDISPGPNIDIVGRAEKIPFPDASFDSIITTQVFEHVENPEQAAQEIARVLRKNGKVLITIPQWNELHEEPHDYWRYTRYGLQVLFERHGFEMISMEQRGGYYALRAQIRVRFALDKYQLHSRPVLGRIASKWFKAQGLIAQWRDQHDHSVANRKHTIGWCAVFRKI